VISEATEDRLRALWAEGIPKDYRFRPKAKFDGHGNGTGAILGAQPPAKLLEAWLASFPPHRTKAQLSASAASAPAKKQASPRKPRKRAAASGHAAAKKEAPAQKQKRRSGQIYTPGKSHAAA
jgi:hypothetical protein